MIIYDLCCDNQHHFEGWFRSAQDFDQQVQRKLICCPQCDSGSVRRVPSPIAISSGRKETAPTVAEERKVSAAMPAGPEAAALYRQLASALISASEDVGHGFAEEARRIHYHEAPVRPIRGQTTDQEYKALVDEGIEVVRLPLIKREDLS